MNRARGSAINSLCECAANTFSGRFLSTLTIVWQQSEFGVTLRRQYMSQINNSHVHNVVLSIHRLAKIIRVSSYVDEHGVSIPLP